MTDKLFNIVGIGEILWDLLPTGKKMLGGTTANFAYIANQLGNNGIIASRVGKDENGLEAINWLKSKRISAENIQTDDEYPTGTVVVSFTDGQPSYEVIKPVAWDFLELTESWRQIVVDCDAVCFGTLGQRAEVSRETICAAVDLTKGLRVFDVNLRQNYYSREVLENSFELANVVKLNHEELPVIVNLLNINGASVQICLEKLVRRFDLKLICLTRGANGSLLMTKKDVSEHPGLKIEVADTIGAGDAFTAGMTHGLLRNWKLDKINEFANKVGAFVASKTGAMPDFKEFEL